MSYAVSCAISYFIGKAIGEGDEDAIKAYFRVGIYLSLALGCVQVAIMIALKDHLFTVFTDSEEVKDLLNQAWPVALAFSFLNYTNWAASAGMRATGKQKFAAIVTWVSFGVSGLFISYICTVKAEMGLAGTWMGPTVTLMINICAYLLIWTRIDWPQLID